MIKMTKEITDMNGKEFKAYINEMLNSDNKDLVAIANLIYEKYFGNRGIDIEESWNDDPDDVWDAEATLSDVLESYRKISENYEMPVRKEENL